MTTDSPGIRAVELPETLDPSRLRVTVVSDSTPERNGVGSYYADLVEQLGTSISHAELICPEDRQTSWHRYLAPPLPGDSTQKIWLPRPFKLWSHISRIDPHAVVVPTPGPFGIAGMLAARRLGVPLIVGFHTHYEALTDIYWTDAFGRVCRSYLTWCNKLLFRNSSLVLANSPEMTRQATLMGAAGVELMGTSVPGAFLSRPRVPLNDTTRRILFAGRLAEEKNVPKVIEVARAMPDVEVSIAGDGPLKSIVEEAAGALPNLAYLGWVAREGLIDTMDAHDILL
jgi:glycosyltransferase involved in cell wall biosynthesis